MDETVLVVADLAPDLIEAGRTLLTELDAKSLPFDAAFWLLDSDSAKWHLYLGTHLVRESGSLALYKKVARVLEKLGLPDRFWIGMVTIVGMRSKIVQALISQLGTAISVDGVRLDSAIIQGIRIPACLLYRLTVKQALAFDQDRSARPRSASPNTARLAAV